MKIERAKAHLNDLERQVQAFHGRQPYLIFVDENSQPGKLRYRVKIVECAPSAWSAIIGDIVHNLRSSLDLLATALVAANGGSTKHTYFPFNRDKAEFESKTLYDRMRGASPKALRFVNRLKPYPGGNESLWKLHQLDILDKHQAIIPVGAANKSTDPDLAAYVTEKGEGFDQIRALFKAIPFFLRPADRQYPMQDGAVLLICPVPEPGQSKPNPKFTFEVAFGEGQIVDGEPVVATLHQFVQLVERIVGIARKHFF